MLELYQTPSRRWPRATGVQSIPTVAIFRDGEPVSGFVGAYPPATIGIFLDDLLAQENEAAAA